MKRGWRNDPVWVEHYRKRDSERIMREMERMRIKSSMREVNAELARHLKSVKIAEHNIGGLKDIAEKLPDYGPKK